MPIDLNIVSAGSDTSAWLPAIRGLLADPQNLPINTITSPPIHAPSVPMMIHEMLNRCGGRAHSIRKVVIFGHGIPGCQFVGCGNSWPQLEAHRLGVDPATKALQNATDVARLRGYFAPDGHVTMLGCNVASGTIGRELLIRLATLWQISVAADQDTVSTTHSGNLPLAPMTGRLLEVVFNRPGSPLRRGRSYFDQRPFSIETIAISGTPETSVSVSWN